MLRKPESIGRLPRSDRLGNYTRSCATSGEHIGPDHQEVNRPSFSGVTLVYEDMRELKWILEDFPEGRWKLRIESDCV